MKRMELDAERDALLAIDVQNDFCSDGALAVPGGEEIVPLINSLMPHFATVVLTQDWHPPGHLSFASSHAGQEPYAEIELPYGRQTLWPDHCVQASRGAEFHPLLVTSTARIIVRKGMRRRVDSYSAFFENDRKTPTGLSGALREAGVGRLFLTGLATDFCVLYTATDARRLGYEVVLIQDACRGIDVQGSLRKALDEMAAAGVEMVRSRFIL
jgi:nicotinamidase/pyrazinamidase